MDPVSLEFILSGLREFVGGINEANDALGGLNSIFNKTKPGTSELEAIFTSVGNAIKGFGERVWDVATVTIGVLLRDAIRGAIDLLTDLAKSAFDAGAELQQVSLRLQGFNMQTLVDAGMKYTDAMTKAVDITKQQLSWIMQLAATTPYDATDIAFVFSMSEAFGYTAEQSKVLTQNTLDFVAAMGLTGVEAKRIIINLGQMAQRGKITTREMNDLARGSLVPLRDILDRVAKKMNTTTAELTKMIAKPGEGVDYKLFMDAFNEMIQTEERFIGAGGRMAHTFKGAMENVYQTLRDLIGNFILLPAFLDPIGKRVGDLMDTIGEEKNWKAITGAVERIGLSLQGITTQILDAFFPSTARQNIVDRIVSSLDSISNWLKIHQKDIIDFFLGTETWKPFGQTEREGGLFKDIGKIVQDVAGFVGKLVDAFNTISDWVTKNKPTIDKFFTTLGDIVTRVFNNLTLGAFKTDMKGGLGGFLDVLTKIMQWVIDHEDLLANLATQFIAIWLAVNLTQMAFTGLANALLTVLNPFNWLKLAVEAVIITFGIFLVELANMGDEAFRIVTNINWRKIGADILSWVLEGLLSIAPAILSFFGVGKEGTGILSQIVSEFYNIPWVQIGVDIIMGIVEGITKVGSVLVETLRSAGQQAVAAFMGAFGLGGLIPQGWTGGGGKGSSGTGGGGKEGNKYTALPIVNNATALVSIPTMPASNVSSSAVVNNNFNLVVNTAAQRESVIQDYEMLRSMMS